MQMQTILPATRLAPATLVSAQKTFKPTQIPGCQLWLPADRITGLNNGDPVTTWKDESGNGRNATQDTAAKKPTYKRGIINGLPVVRFDGVDDVLVTAAFQTFPSKRGAIFVVAKTGAIVGDRTVLGATYTVDIGWVLSHDVGALDLYWYDKVASQTLEAVDPTGWDIWEVVRTSDTSLTFLRNGVQKNTITIANNQPDSVVFNIGGANSSGTWNSDIAEVILYEGAKSPSERARVRRYLGRKYLLPVTP